MDSGASIPAWSGRRATEALEFVKSRGRRNRTPCCICEQKIDYSLPSTHPHGCTVQHLKSRRDFPELTWVRSNWGPAHHQCNSSAGAGDRDDTPGVTSEEW